MSAWLYVLAGLFVLNALVTICMTGKPRNPVTPWSAAGTVICTAMWVTVLIISAGRLR